MPIPALAVMAMMMAASMAANSAAQKKVDKGRAAALEEEARRRRESEKESAATAKSTGDLLLDTANKEKDSAAKLETEYAAATKNPIIDAIRQSVVGEKGPTAATTFVQTAADAKARTDKDTAQRGKSLAGLGAFGDVMAGNQLQLQRNQSDIGRAGSNLMNWNQYVLPTQLEAANHRGDDWKNLADAIQVASMIYGGSALAAKGATAGATAAGANVANDTAAGLTGDALTRAGNNAYWLNQGYGSNFVKPQPGMFY